MIAALWSTRPYPFAASWGVVTAPAGVLLYRWDVPDDYEPPEGLEVRDDDGSPLWTPPPAPLYVPESVEMFQLRAALHAMPSEGSDPLRTLHDDFDDLLQITGGVELLAWEYSANVLRSAGFLQRAAEQLGVTSDMLDEAFISGVAIQA